MPSINNSLQDFSRHIENHIQESISAVSLVRSELIKDIYTAANIIIDTFKSGHKILIAGNGGSAADAQHIAAEFTIRLNAEIERPSLPAVALSTDTSALTAAGNDFGFNHIFKRQLEGLAQPGDCFMAISTSGNSQNLIDALQIAREKNIRTIALLGKDGGVMKELAEVPIIVRANNTMHVQEAHICIYHLICDLVERSMY